MRQRWEYHNDASACSFWRHSDTVAETLKQRQKPHKLDRTPRWQSSSRTLRHTIISHEDPKIVRSAQLRRPALAYVPIVDSTHSRADTYGDGRMRNAPPSNAASSPSQNCLRSKDGRPQQHSRSQKGVHRPVRSLGTRFHPRSCGGWPAMPHRSWTTRMQTGRGRVYS